jgi:malonyl-ACP decarboxylase
MRPQILVTGIGVVTSLGLDCARFSESLKQAKSGIGFLKPVSEHGGQEIIAAELPEIRLNDILQSKQDFDGDIVAKAQECSSRVPSCMKSSICSSLEAWHHAGLHERPIPEERVGIVVAGHNLTGNYQFGLMEKFLKSPEYLSPWFAIHNLDSDHVGILSEIFSIHGEGFAVGDASASGNVGIIKALQLLELGYLDACLVVGAQADLSPMELQGYRNIGAYGGKQFADRPEGACRPFDRDHEGFIYGQGSGCLVLETHESAMRRGVLPLAEIVGGAIVLAGNRLSDPSETGEICAMRLALERAQVEPHEVQYINAHGTSSPLGDDVEVKAIKEVFQSHLPDVWINSTKGLTGHCLYSAGVIEAIATIIQMREGFVHGNANLNNPIDDECHFCSAQSTSANISTALSNSFGFGGVNTSIILKRGG